MKDRKAKKGETECHVEGCGRVAQYQQAQVCSAHYVQSLRGGPLKPLRQPDGKWPEPHQRVQLYLPAKLLKQLRTSLKGGSVSQAVAGYIREALTG